MLTIPTVRPHLPERILASVEDRRLSFGLRNLNSLVGRRTADSVALSPDDGAGYALFGPYISVEPGLYTVDVAYRCTGDLGGSYFEITGSSGQEHLIAWLVGDHPDRCNGALQHARMRLDAARPVSLLEVRAFYGGAGDLSIAGVKMIRGRGEG